MRAARQGCARARCEAARAVGVCAARGPGRLTQSRSRGRWDGFAFWKTTESTRIRADLDKSCSFPSWGVQGGRVSHQRALPVS